jgi:hypothetical protein
MTEYRISVPVRELGIRNTELRVIDTPGLGDTRGMEKDAQFLATLDSCLANHEDLKDKIPNVVMVFEKFTENRFGQKGSKFVKMLQSLDLFSRKLLNRKYSNVVVVLTHFMGRTPKEASNPRHIIDSFKQVIEEYSLFPKPIVVVVAENRPEDENLPLVNGFYRLPSGDYYPRNLFEKIQLATTNGGDPIGEAVIRTAFKDPELLSINETVYHKLVELNDTKVSHYLGILSRYNFDVKDTEVSQLLKSGLGNLSEIDLRKYPGTLPYLQKCFNIRNIQSKAEIPKTSVGMAGFLRDIRLTPPAVQLLDVALGMKAAKLGIPLIAGRSYNLIHDTVLSASPFMDNRFVMSDIGYMIPDTLTCTRTNVVANIYEVFGSEVEARRGRLSTLFITEGVNLEELKFKPRVGANIISITDRTIWPEITLSARREHRVFDLTLNDRPELTKEFRETIERMPDYNSSNHVSVDWFKDFFAK